MKVGFTGTRNGFTESQKVSFQQWVRMAQGVCEFHHGCCVGADAFAVLVVSEEMPELPVIISHPGNWGPMTDRDANSRSAEVRPCRPMLDRNRDIVNACELLLAVPKGPEEVRSGTWTTVRYARKTGTQVRIFWPDGSVTNNY